MPSTGEAKKRQNYRRNAMRDAKRTLARAYRIQEQPLHWLVTNESLPIDLREEAMDLGCTIQQQIAILGEVRHIPKKAQATAALLNLVGQAPPAFAMQFSPLQPAVQPAAQPALQLQQFEPQPQPVQAKPVQAQPVRAQSLQPEPLQLQPQPQPQLQLQPEPPQPKTPSSPTPHKAVVAATPSVLDDPPAGTEGPPTPPASFSRASRVQPTPTAEQQPYSAAGGVWLPCPADMAGTPASAPEEQPKALPFVPVFGSSGSLEGAAWGSTLLPVLDPEEAQAGAENAVCYGMCEVNGGTYYIMYG